MTDSFEPPLKVTAALDHLHGTYAHRLNVQDNIHVLCGFFTPTVSVPFAMGVSTPHCIVEKAAFSAFTIKEPLEQIGAADADGMWVMYIAAPDGAYEDDVPLGRNIEWVVYGRDGSAERWACHFPPDYPEAKASLSVVGGSFPWEL